jgi:hypothetical protein
MSNNIIEFPKDKISRVKHPENIDEIKQSIDSFISSFDTLFYTDKLKYFTSFNISRETFVKNSEFNIYNDISSIFIAEYVDKNIIYRDTSNILYTEDPQADLDISDYEEE